ncbi:MAG: hypothetical protein HC902_01230, partial [Calothrix sp. SM1_5_4]|nr:hypothetical protein [Calothrix sp. SM1_5_4]
MPCRFFLLLTLPLLTSLVVASTALAERPRAPRRGSFGLSAGLNYFDSAANYSDGGGSAELPAGASFTEFQGLFEGNYDFSDNWRTSAGMTYNQVDTSNGVLDRSNGVINELWLGGQYWFRARSFALVPDALFAYPMFRVDEGGDDALAGEGAMRFRAGSWAIFRLFALQPFAYLGLEYRDAGRSSLLPYAAGLYFKPTLWWIQGSFRGYESVTDG